MIQPGLGYTVTSTPEGQTLQIDSADSFNGGSAPEKYEQFQIVIQGNAIKVVSGTVLWASHNFGGEDAGTDKCANQSTIATFARYTGDTVSVGTNPSSIMMSENGKVTLGT